MSHHEIKGTVGEWTFYEVTNHGFTGEFAGRPLYEFTTGELDKPRRLGSGSSELYPSLEHAMAAAIAQKYTGRRSAAGSGVGTAADWFMRMIGADQLQPAGDAGRVALTSALVGNGMTADRWAVQRVEKTLEDRGVVLAHVKS